MGTYYPSHNYGAEHAGALGSNRSISEKQLEANRRNALRSTGPRTEEGKTRSRTNAVRHSLTGQIDVLAEEDRIAKDAFCDSLIQSLQPEGAHERQIALSIAHDHWRLNRIRAMEDNIFALGHYSPAADIDVDHPELHAALTSARVFLESANEFQLLTLYEQRIGRNVAKNTAQLEALQSKRRAARAEALEEAATILRVAEFEGAEPEPDHLPGGDAASPDSGELRLLQNGFVFSHTEIRRCIRRQDRLKAAAFHEKHNWDPDIPFPQAA